MEIRVEPASEMYLKTLQAIENRRTNDIHTVMTQITKASELGLTFATVDTGKIFDINYVSKIFQSYGYKISITPCWIEFEWGKS